MTIGSIGPCCRRLGRVLAIGLPLLVFNAWSLEEPALGSNEVVAQGPTPGIRDAGGPPEIAPMPGPAAADPQRQSRRPAPAPGDWAVLTQSEREHIQFSLSQLGYYTGAIDGLYGPQTRSAIRTFLESIGARPAGTLDPMQISELHQRAAQITQAPPMPRRPGCTGSQG